MVKSIFFIMFLLIATYGCNYNENDSPDSWNFDFKDTIRISNKLVVDSTPRNEIRIAVSAISSPRETFAYYSEMFEYIERETGMKVTMVQRKTYEQVNQLLKNSLVDLAFICSGGYVYGMLDSAFSLLVIPERNSLRKYQSYIIVHKELRANSIEDLRGKRFAFTDQLSTAGKLYPQKKLKDLNEIPCDFFSSNIFTYAHDNSIQLVAKKMVDGAAVNSLVFEYISAKYPDRVKNIKIIDRSPWFAMPPVVVSNGLPEEMKKKLKRIFLNIHEDKGSKEVLEKLMIDRFVEGNDTIFNNIRLMVEYIKE